MKIVFSCGDINGIGLEVMFKALVKFYAGSKYSGETQFCIVIDPETLYKYSLNIKQKVIVKKDHFSIRGKRIDIIPAETGSEVNFGKITESSGKLAAESIEKSAGMTINGDFDAMVTLPVNKAAIYKTGWKFPGHTEMIADKCNDKNPLMILCTNSTRVALVTIHEPLKNVPKLISSDLIYNLGIKFSKSLLKDFKERNPSIAVLGLNPHSGESGSIGTEEEKVIKPAIKRLREAGVEASGPFPADGFFAHGEYMRFGGILAMYHDQGLIPLKLIAMGAGVNFTAGLPIVRTSPDHGTGFDIAGKNIADERSTYNAIELAVMIANNRRIKSK